MSKRIAIVLAAGQGTRMKTDKPKVLAEVCGRPLVDYVLDALELTGYHRVIVVVGYKADDVRAALADRKNVEFVEQTEQLGTGHAVKMCLPNLEGHTGSVLVLTGDSPLVQTESINALTELFEHDKPVCVMGTLHKKNPFGLGRIVRDEEGNFAGIVEEHEATEKQRMLTEVNMSTYIFDGSILPEVLGRLTNNNKKGEYYITDCPGILIEDGRDVRALPVLKPCESLSINTVDELAIVEEEMLSLGYKDAMGR